MNPDLQGGVPLDRTPEVKPPLQTPMGQNYRFTQEELRVLRQCNRDSFYQRCLPIGTALGGATYFAVKNGYFRPHVRFGAAPKVTAAVVIGYFIGKFSYQSKCAEMLMKLPDSQIGEMLRQKRRQGGSTSYTDTISLDPGFGTGFSIPFGETEVYSDIAPTHDLDSDRPYQKGLDDFYRPSLDSPATGEEIVPPVTQPRVQTYEELRRKNREEYEQRKGKPYRSGAAPEDVPTTLQPQAQPPLAEPSHSPQRPLERNQYGDVWEK